MSQRGAGPLGGSSRGRVPLYAGTLSLCACTLTSGSFDPDLVTGVDAGPLGAIEGSSVPLDESDAVSPGCSASAAAGGDDPRCSGPIGLLPAASPVADAGVVEAASGLSLPPCAGELGAFGEPEPITGLDFDENVFGPALSADGKTLYFSAYVGGEQQIYAATREERGAAFAGVRVLPGVNSPASDGSPFVSADGRRLYLFSERFGGIGGRDVWISQRERDDASFSTPALLAGINSPATDLLPWLTSDELTLLFVSNRIGGLGGADLWLATREDAGDDFGVPINLAELSSDENEGRAVFSGDGLTAFFSSDRDGGRGGPDLWVARREGRRAPFSAPENLRSLNSPANDQDVALSSDETELFFASSRGGTSALWRAERRCE